MVTILKHLGGKNKKGEKVYKSLCSPCNDREYSLSRRAKNRRIKKNYCESCGFVAEHPIQLDVDHIDGKHNNNNPSNLQTLCANCHRLKTWKNKDWENKKEA